MSYLTDAEKLRLSLMPPSDDAPIGYLDVTQSQLSIARHSGRATVNGRRYTYFPATDELWRDDIVRMIEKWRKDEAKSKTRPAPAMVQGSLIEGG